MFTYVGDVKFVSAGDNAVVKVWDWGKGIAELTLAEHHSDVRCVAWHPFRSLIASGSKDNSIKLWDPRQSVSLATLFSHKNTVLCCEWSKNGNWLATGSRYIHRSCLLRLPHLDTSHPLTSPCLRLVMTLRLVYLGTFS